MLPSPPHLPPPPSSEHGVLRSANDEQPSDPDCAPVTYSACLRAAQEMHAADPRVSPNIELSQAPCEGTGADVSSCFIQRASVAAEFAQFMSHRCADSMDHPFCLCGAAPPPPPPAFESVTILSKKYAYAGQPVSGTIEAQPSGFFKPAAVDSKLPSEFALHTTSIECRGSDDGAPTCTRHCARNMLSLLKAFHVTAYSMPPSPPPPSPPPLPPRPPPSPSPPLSEFRFNGATDGCAKNGFYRGNQCRDGGVGSVYPPLCDYGSSVSACGHRPNVGRGAVIGDDSCETANNNECEDGGEGTSYWAEDSNGARVAVCGFATEYVKPIQTRKHAYFLL
jgi:hypothetical protein